MSTEYPETIYYYAARHVGKDRVDPHRAVSETQRQKWKILFIISSITVRANGMYNYRPDEDYIEELFFLHHISYDDHDLLDAFGVPSVWGFETKQWKIDRETLFPNSKHKKSATGWRSKIMKHPL
jgi:hypothetical protein